MTDPKETGRSPTLGDLERLRNLIFGEEKSRLHNLDRRVSDLESRTADVAEVLPGAMNRLVDNPVTKPNLERPIVDTIRGAIKRDTESFAEALFPVIGPAIRRAVADALKSLVQRINVALENSFTVKGLRWRMEAARSGVPFAQVVLRHTMVYAIQEAFLIQRKSGLVLCGVRRDDTLALDEDAVSAMLTAIQAFIQDSLGLPNDEPLRSAELGDRTLWVINGPDALLACIITGEPPREVRIELMKILESLHAQFGNRFGDHPELLASDTGLIALMQEVLREEVDEQASGSSSPKYKWLWSGVALLAIAVIVWSGWTGFRDYRLESDVASRFGAEPGYVLTASNVERGKLRLAGLRDPLAADPAAILTQLGVDVDDTEQDFRPYQSLEAAMILQRLTQALGSDDSIVLELDGERLNVAGSLSARQQNLLDGLPGTHPVIRSINFSQSRLSASEAEALIRQRLDAPATVSISPAEDRMLLAGTAEPEWFEAGVAVTDAVGGWRLDFGPLRESLTRQMTDLAARINGQTIQFTRGYQFSAAAQAELAALASRLVELQKYAAALDAEVPLRLEGFTDGVGSADKNREVALNRARAVQDRLRELGVDVTDMSLAQGRWSEGSVDISQRKVVIFLDRAGSP